MIFRVLSLLSALSYVAGSHYVIPDVRVEVYYPRGIRIWIPHEEGTRLFAFHGNLNRAMRNYEIGEYYKDVLEPVDGKWVYEDRVLRLRRGDKLYYWIYVLFNKLGYRRDNLVYTVTDLIDGEMPDLASAEKDRKQKTKPVEVACTERPEVQQEVEQEVVTTTEASDDLQVCQKTILNLTPKLINLELEFAELKQRFALLSEIVNAKGSSKMLTMSGRISKQEPALDVVKFILNEKLDLKPEVVFAERNLDDSIDFQVSNVQELLAVVKATRAKLTNSKAVQIRF